MATTLAVTPLSRAGVDEDATMTAADATGNNWPTTGTEWLRVKNANGSSITVSLTLVRQVDGQTPPAKTIVIPNGKTYVIGPMTSDYNTAASPPLVGCTFSAAAGVTVGVFKAQ